MFTSERGAEQERSHHRLVVHAVAARIAGVASYPPTPIFMSEYAKKLPKTIDKDKTTINSIFKKIETCASVRILKQQSVFKGTVSREKLLN